MGVLPEAAELDLTWWPLGTNKERDGLGDRDEVSSILPMGLGHGVVGLLLQEGKLLTSGDQFGL